MLYTAVVVAARGMLSNGVVRHFIRVLRGQNYRSGCFEESEAPAGDFCGARALTVVEWKGTHMSLKSQ